MGFSPTLTYGPNKFYGPTEYRVVKVHDNHPPTSSVSARQASGTGGGCLLGGGAELEATARADLTQLPIQYEGVGAPPTALTITPEDSWRWRESNPRPS